MGVIRAMVERRWGDWSLDEPSDGLRRVLSLGSPRTWSGVPVTTEGAMRIAAVYACVRILAGIIASLPLMVYQRTPAGRRRADDHDLYPLLHDAPNPEMTSYQWRESVKAGELLWGNGYSRIDYDRRGRVRALWPLPPQTVTPRREADGQIVYDVEADGQTVRLPSWRVLHFAGLGFDGLVGRSRVALFREGLGLAVAAERHGAAFFGSGARPSVVLEHPLPLKRQAVEAIRQMWRDDHGGPENFQSVAVLSEGMRLHEFAIPHDDAQFLETRQFQVAEIARMFGVPLWMLNEHTKDTSWGSGIEQQFLAFLAVTLVPELRRWEQALTTKLLSNSERAAGYYCEANVDGLLRGDAAARANYLKTMREIGVYSVDDVRALLNEPKIGGEAGAERIRPANFVPIGTPAPGQLAAQDWLPLLRETWRRVLQRGAQDWPAAVKRAATDQWASELDRYAREQIGLVAAAMGCDVETWMRRCAHLLSGEPPQWDVHERAAEAAALCLGGHYEPSHN